MKMPLDRNPVARVERYREQAPEIRYLTREQIDEQLGALRGKPQPRVMVATLIYAGLRRDELVWLQDEDFVRAPAQAPNGLLRIQAKTSLARVGNRRPRRTERCRIAAPYGAISTRMTCL